MKFISKKLFAGAFVAVVAVASIAFASASNAVYTQPDCTTNSIIKCGASTISILRTKYNASTELKNLYGHFGLTSTIINKGKVVDGVIYTDGTITVGGKVVATNAHSVGRNIDSGSGCNGTPFTVAGHTYYEGTTKCRFGTRNGQAAYVFLDANGQFIGAINKTCGNPTPAKPVIVPPKPVYTCDLLTANQITRTEYEFTATASVNSTAKVTGYSFNFGDGTSAAPKSSATKYTTTHTYTNPGVYTVTVTPSFTAAGKTVTATSTKCKVTVTVAAPTPVYTCKLLTQSLVTGTQYKFNGSATASNGATVTGYTLDFGDGTTPFTGTTVANVMHTYAQKDATYTARLTANINVNGKTVTTTSDACAVVITISIPKIQVCDLTTHKVVTINESDFDSSKYSKNPDDCTPVKVCDLTTGKITIIKQSQYDDSKYTTDLDACTPIQVCDLTTKQVVTIMQSQYDNSRYSQDLTNCTTPPVTPPVTPPTVLPETGIGDGIVTTIGIGSLIASASYYIASRRGLSR